MQHNYLSGQSRNNHKTMRISDKSLEFILTFEGSTFNDQVNNMIDYFINAKPVYEIELQYIEQKIEAKNKILSSLQAKSYELSNLINDLNNYVRNLRY
jgi:hypothetical protein